MAEAAKDYQLMSKAWNADTVNLDAISKLLQNQEVFLEVVVGDGKFSETVWGCDLTKDYIEENAFYTT